jgi:hypothetical protein
VALISILYFCFSRTEILFIDEKVIENDATPEAQSKI